METVERIFSQYCQSNETLSTALFYVSLTVHPSIFISVINQLDAQNLFFNKFISCLYMFRAQRHEISLLKNKFCASVCLITKIN